MNKIKNKPKIKNKKISSIKNPSSLVKKATAIKKDTFISESTFDTSSLHSKLKANIKAKGYKHLTEIQDRSIDHILKKKTNWNCLYGNRKNWSLFNSNYTANFNT